MTDQSMPVWRDDVSTRARMLQAIAIDQVLFRVFPRLSRSEAGVTTLLPYYAGEHASDVLSQLGTVRTTATIGSLMVCTPSWIKGRFKLEADEIVALLMALDRFQQEEGYKVFMDAVSEALEAENRARLNLFPLAAIEDDLPQHVWQRHEPIGRETEKY